MDEMMSIGRFARQAGLSIGALRHYHELGVLVPASVDAETSYRSYHRSQLEDARLIARLRELDLSLPDIRAVLGADRGARQRLLSAHRARLRAGLARTQRQIHWLNQAIDHEEPIVTTTPPAAVDPGTRRQLAVDLFNHVWTLLETPDRTPMQDDEMLHAAHASRYHWGEVGEPVNLARGEWQCSRVYAVLGRVEPALWHGRRCLALCEEHGIADFDICFAWEAIARALKVAGDDKGSAEAVARARELAGGIAEDEDRELLESDLATIG
ncbi:MAG TPA: helix-turn-helix domain-containing protein [Candidatus Limnocylindria bacterium]